MMKNMDFKQLIASKGFTMYRLAKKAKLGQSTINQLANKKRKNANMQTLISIANALDISVDEVSRSIRGN